MTPDTLWRVGVDFAVVGGGIAGVSVAAELAERGASVTVLEQEDRLAHHSSGRSAATFLESYGSPEIRALTRASRRDLDLVEPGEAPLLTHRPLLWVAAAANVSIVDDLVAGEPLLRAVEPDEARSLCPVLRAEWLAAAAIEEGAQDLDVAGLFDRYRRRAMRAGVVMRTGAGVTSGVRVGDGWRLHTTGGAVEAAVVVNAAGAWADSLATALGMAAVGLRPLRRTVAIVSSDQVRRDWPFVGEVSDTFYFRPEGDALLLSPADETPSAPVDARVSTEDVALALERANEATTLNLRHVRTSWAGLRTFAADRNPVVGPDPSQPGFFWLAGQGGYGMQTAPALARLAAAVLVGEPVPADLTGQGLDLALVAPDRLLH
jgi:D-arginine dehydrogenase